MSEQLSHALLKWMDSVSRTMNPAGALSCHKECTKMVDLQCDLLLVQTLDRLISQSKSENESPSEETNPSELLSKIVNDLEEIYHYHDMSELRPSSDGIYSELHVQKIVERTLGCVMLFGDQSDTQQYVEPIMELEQGPQMCLMQSIQVSLIHSMGNIPTLDIFILCLSCTQL